MRTEIKNILAMFPEGIKTADQAAQTMAALTMVNSAWHWDDNPQDVFSDKEEGDALLIVSDTLWSITNKHFNYLDHPMWEGLVGELDTMNGVYCFRTGTLPESKVYVATAGKACTAQLSDWQDMFDAYQAALENDDQSTMPLDWMHNHEPYEPSITVTQDESETIEVKAELLFELKSKQDWVNRVPSILPSKTRGKGEVWVWIDKNGHVFECGADFAAAERLDTYPCKVYRAIPVSATEK